MKDFITFGVLDLHPCIVGLLLLESDLLGLAVDAPVTSSWTIVKRIHLCLCVPRLSLYLSYFFCDNHHI
jgi:hypothetical protein